MTQAEFPATSSSRNLHIYELWSRSKSQGAKNIYIYIIIHSYSIYIFWDYKAKRAEKTKTFLQETIFQKGEAETFPVHSGPLSLNKQPLNPQIPFTDL